MIAFPQFAWDISIHALREEGDVCFLPCCLQRS